MPVVQFQCPQCLALLRLENRALFLGRTFPCPDCGASLLIESNGSDGVLARLTTATVAAKPERSDVPRVKSTLPTEAEPVRLTDLGVNLQPRRSVLDKIGQRPALLGWSIAALFAIVLFVLVSPRREQSSQNSAAQPATDSPTKNDAAASNPASTNQPVDERAAAEHQAEANRRLAQKPSHDNAAAPVEPAPAARVLTPPALKFDGQPEKRDDNKVDVPVIPVPPEPKEPPVIEANELKPLPPVAQEAVAKIEARLRQKIARFEQQKPVAFIKLLDIVEELAGVSIVWELETVDDEQLQKLVTIRLQETTVEEILDTLLQAVGLTRRMVPGKIMLSPRSALEQKEPMTVQKSSP